MKDGVGKSLRRTRAVALDREVNVMVKMVMGNIKLLRKGLIVAGQDEEMDGGSASGIYSTLSKTRTVASSLEKQMEKKFSCVGCVIVRCSSSVVR